MIDRRTHVEAVGRFYDDHADAFARVYGDVIQALRTKDVTRLLDVEAAAMELTPGLRLLDAGCGVGGPAVYFAARYGVDVDAVNASAAQVRIAAETVRRAGLEGRVRVHHGDYHELARVCPAGGYDVVCFLESFGHSPDKRAAIASTWEMLKPGGRFYIKDLFAKEPQVEAHRAAIADNIRRINEAYCYQVGDLYDVVRDVRTQGFILAAVKTVDIPLEDFENLTISNDFQSLTGINRIDDLASYVFPVEFFEIIALKPWHGPSTGHTRYFLQNLYNLQVLGVPVQEM